MSVSGTASSITVEAIASVSGVCSGTLSAISNVSFALGIPKIRNQNKGFLYAEIPNSNIASVNLEKISKSFSIKSSSSLVLIVLPLAR